MIKTTGLSRHKLLLSSSIVSVGVLLAGAAAATTAGALNTTATTITAAQAGDVTVRGVEFMNNDITMSGNIYYPKGFNESRKYPAIVVVQE